MDRNELTAVVMCGLMMGLLSACNTTSREEQALENDNLEVVDKLQPTRLEADLNGDDVNDSVLFVAEKSSHKRGLCILHGGTDRCIVLGAGHPFANGGDDFQWLDHWELVPAGETSETTFSPEGDVEGERKMVLEQTSISVREEEGSGGVITYAKGSYHWVHQGD